MLGQVIGLLFYQVPFLIIGCLIWHLILIKRHQMINFYRLLILSLLIGEALHLGISYLLFTYKLYTPLVLIATVPTVVTLSIYISYCLGKLNTTKVMKP